MARKTFAKLMFFALTSMAVGVTGVFAQSESCGLVIDVKRDDTKEAISAAAATAVNAKTKKIYRATLRKGLPFFASLNEGEYKITVSKAGFKKSIDNYELNCRLKADGFVTIYIPLWQGSAREFVSVKEIYPDRGPLKSTPLSSTPLGASEYKAAPERFERQSTRLNPKVLNGKATNLVKPAYPAAAKAVRAEGAVNVLVTIDEQGKVISASAVSGHPLLRAAAVQAARASTFSPTLLSGQPVKVTGIIVYNFVP